MNVIDALFLDHPRDVGETFGEHFTVASTTSARLIVAGAACGVHALVPVLFKTTASRTIIELNQKMKDRAAAARAGSTTGFEGGDWYYI